MDSLTPALETLRMLRAGLAAHGEPPPRARVAGLAEVRGFLALHPGEAAT